MSRFSFPIRLGLIVLLLPLPLVNSGCGIGTPSPPAMTPYTTSIATPTSTTMATPTLVPTTRPSPSPRATATSTPSDERPLRVTTVTPVGQVLITPVIDLPRGPYYPGGPAYVDWKQLAWRPEGQMLAYVGADEAKGTYVAAALDFPPRKLALGSAAQVLWSPDGQRLALLYWSEPEGYHLRLVDPSGNTLDEVDLGYYSVVMNCWLDNERLTIIRHRGTGAEELLEVHISEHKIYPLVTWEDEGRKLTMVGTDFHWSPDRNSLVIERWSILVVDAIQWKATDLGEFMEGPYHEFESWAPDSTQFLYEEWGKPNFPLLEAKPSLYLWDIAQGEGRWLLPNVWGAAWSPRGDEIAFLLLGNPQRDEQGRIRDTDFVPGQRCALPGERCALYVGVMDPNTYEVRALVSAGQVASMGVLLDYPFFFGGQRPVWSPDGELLVYWDANGNLWIMRGDGTGQRQLTQGLEVKEVAWSPDGSLLAIAADDRIVIIERP